MALIDDLQISLPNQRLNINASSGTFYEARDWYSLLQNLFDEIGAIALAGSIAYPTPVSAQTPTDYTIKDKWYQTQSSYKNLKGGSIQSSGFDGEIYLLTLASGGYVSAISGDLFKTVTGATSTATGKLLDFDNTLRAWRVRKLTGTFVSGEVLSIATGTGAGTTVASVGALTGEDGHANAYTVGTLAHGNTYFAQGTAVSDGTGWYGASNVTGNHIDILIKVKESGTLLSSGAVVFYNRNNRDAANALDGALTGDTYDWFAADLSSFGRTPVPLTTEPDLDDTLTNTIALNYLNGTSATIALTTGTFSSVDINQDGITETYSGQVDQSVQTNAILWSVIKYYFRKGSVSPNVNSESPQLFRFLNAGYAVVKKSPVANIAGGKLFYARGWYPTNVPAGAASNYQTITNAGVVTDPPTFYSRSRTGVPIGAKVIIARRSTTNFVLTTEFTLAAGNNSGNSTLVLSGSIPTDKPSKGFVRVFDNAGNEDRYAYVNFTAATFTLLAAVSQVIVTNGGTGYSTAPTVSFTGGGGVGATAVAVVSGGIVVAINVTAEGIGYTSAPTVGFTGGGGTGAAATASVTSGTLTKTYATGNNAYVPYIDTIASSSAIAVALRYIADRDVVSFVRLGSGASKITGDVANYTLSAADSAVPVTAISDSINNN